MKPRHLHQFLIVPAVCIAATGIAQAVDFPGPLPGAAKASRKSGTYTLSNRLLSVSWQERGGHLQLVGASNSLSRARALPGDREIFRLSTQPAAASNVKDGFYLGWKLDGQNVTALYGDGKTWRPLQTFSRALFPGAPRFLRIGKMSLKADGTDYADAGESGSSRFDSVVPADLGAATLKPSSRIGTELTVGTNEYKVGATANTTAYAQWALKAGTSLVSARIWKDTDAGQSWGPGIALVWPNGKFALVNARAPLGEFSIATQDGESVISKLPPIAADYNLPSSAFRMLGAPVLKMTSGGQELVARFRHSEKPLEVEWHALLRDNAHYLRQKVVVKATADAGTLSNIEVVDFPIAGTAQMGSVPGSPIAGQNWFFGAELPVGANDVTSDARSSIACQLPLTAGASYDFGSVAGVYPAGQLRRSLLAYVEQERARPTSPFLHYNCWYDLAQNVNAKDLSASIAAFHDEMTTRRGVKVDSYVIDDGWDDSRNTFWGVDAKKFPAGLNPVAGELKNIDSYLGMWISPLGGYGEARIRTENARKLGLVQPGRELDLSYAPYYNWYRDYHLELMRDFQVNYFKWDKAGDGVNPHFMALVRVANELRQKDPNLFINVTVGTWPSPFWLNHIDTTWRAGADIGWTGPGDKREQWLNYRDGELYNRVVKPAPLYPLNSIMHHGIAYGLYYQGKTLAPAGPDLKHDARSYFATGATLQELYLTPSMMTKNGWDEVAAGAKWSRQNFDVLADSHWIGGDPGKGEVYGYASWAPRKGIFMLRNPSDKQGTITIDAAQVFELPQGAKRNFTLSSPYADQRIKTGELRAGKAVTFTLEPFEVLALEAIPR